MPNDKSYYVVLVSQGTIDGLLVSGVWGGRAKSRLASIPVGAMAALYVSGAHAFAGIVEVTSSYYYDITPVWPTEAYPHRVRLSTTLASSDPKCWIDVVPLLPQLSFIQKPQYYGAYFRSSWFKIPKRDFECIETALRERIY